MTFTSENTIVDVLTFWVPGIPAPGGSKKSFRSFTTNKIVTLEDCERTASWRNRIEGYAHRAMVGFMPFDEPLEVDVLFVLPRPKGHFGSGRNTLQIKPSAPLHPEVKPDATKLWRAAEDAMTGIVWRDDAMVIRQRVAKSYGNVSGMAVRVYPIADEPIAEWVDYLDLAKAGAP